MVAQRLERLPGGQGNEDATATVNTGHTDVPSVDGGLRHYDLMHISVRLSEIAVLDTA